MVYPVPMHSLNRLCLGRHASWDLTSEDFLVNRENTRGDRAEAKPSRFLKNKTKFAMFPTKANTEKIKKNSAKICSSFP